MSTPADDPHLADEGANAAGAAMDSDTASDGTDDFFPSSKHHRQGSLMEEVRDRIERLPDITPLQGKLDTSARRATTVAAISASSTVPELNACKKAIEPKCQMSFRTALVCTMVAVVLLSCLGMSMPFTITRTRLSSETLTAQSTTRNQLDMVDGMLNEAFFSSVLAGVGDTIWVQVQALADNDVDQLMDLLWPYMFHQLLPGRNWSSGSCDGHLLLTNGSSPLTACAQSSGTVCNVWAASGFAHGNNCTGSLLWGHSNITGEGQPNPPADLSTSTVRRIWSGVWEANGSLHMSYAAQTAYRGGSVSLRFNVAAVLDLASVQRCLQRHWLSLTRRLGSAEGARLFLVALAPGEPGQEGLLLGSAGAGAAPPRGLLRAADAPDAAVRAAARALLLRFGSWGSPALQLEQGFAFGPAGLACGAGAAGAAAGCTRVAARPLRLGGGLQWLAVLAAPAAPSAVEQAEGGHGQGDWRVGVAVLAGAALLALALGLGLGLGCLAARPLRRLDGLLRRLGDLDFSEAAGVSLGASHIAEVCSLQRSFVQVSQAMEAFARFVPETVVRRIVRGDPRAARLHVSRREVTIMFSDIRDFTAISEALPECDLLFLLTRYLSVMTRIVEHFHGIVAEVLGDGLLVFWNTPDDVPDHPARGCEAALAMQQAVAFLNAEFSALKLPHLAIRVGLHTGRVLSGNLGSELKMKFGCLGDPINLASRLEGLCKFYGVGVICSGSTHDALPPGCGLFCRKLDLVQVKGKKEATWIYEVMGHEPHEDLVLSDICNSADTSAFAQARSIFCKRPSTAALDAIHRSTLSLRRSLSSVDSSSDVPMGVDERAPLPGGAPADFITPEQRALAELYEKALRAYQEARFATARDLASALLEWHPGDAAAARLLERLGRYVGLGPGDDRPVRLTDAERASWTGVFVMAEK